MKVKVAVIQESPVFFDKEACLQKVALLSKKYAAEGCQLLVFPESFIPGYPRGFTFGATIGNRTDSGRELYARYHENSVVLAGKDLEFLERTARENNIYLVLGITEKEPTHGSLYCSMIYLSPTSGLLGVHRKIKPTGTERIVWAEGDASSLVTFDTPVGRLGGLICWENYMPMARISMYRKGVQLYIAPTADARPEWTASLQHIALEGRCFVLGCNQYFTRSMYPEAYLDLLQDDTENMCRGGSVIVSPLGKILQGPLWDQTGVLIASLNLDEVTQSKLDFDPNGHYTRDDLFEFIAKGQPETLKDNV
ncbi:MAG: carbon-nitrogen hydrolase family protein [Flavobacteriaceae bacterium]|nr:carbon-nitrogen hydrolase family protein [Eudoraea sp.]MBT8311442.1 carbon-nitrogen hydrolase family protein [Eudoraea sp.]NNJ37843.1 carbon-nitrogen hydrolase family protein [Flavobacteriaceae bacterium]NNK30215.1 carbon-nitrogen hydrolase family protein [Flavobacteriaceae bacterium]